MQTTMKSTQVRTQTHYLKVREVGARKRPFRPSQGLFVDNLDKVIDRSGARKRRLPNPGQGHGRLA